MTLPTRRSIITGLGAGTGLAAAGLLPQSPAIADDSARDFGSPIFDEQFSQGPDFSPSRWRDNRSEPETCASYDWGVFTHDTHSVSDGVGHLLWRKSVTPLKGFQNRFDKEETIRYVNQAFVTTEGLFSFVYGSLETRARFPQSHQGLFAGIWLRADDGKNGGEIDVVETYGGGSATGIAESTVHYGQAGGKGSNLGVSPKPDLTAWHTYGMEKTPESIRFFFDGRPYHEVRRSDSPQEFDTCFGAGAPYHICLTTHTGSIHRGKLNHEGFTQAQVDIDYIVVRAMSQ